MSIGRTTGGSSSGSEGSAEAVPLSQRLSLYSNSFIRNGFWISALLGGLFAANISAVLFNMLSEPSPWSMILLSMFFGVYIFGICHAILFVTLKPILWRVLTKRQRCMLFRDQLLLVALLDNNLERFRPWKKWSLRLHRWPKMPRQAWQVVRDLVWYSNQYAWILRSQRNRVWVPTLIASIVLVVIPCVLLFLALYFGRGTINGAICVVVTSSYYVLFSLFLLLMHINSAAAAHVLAEELAPTEELRRWAKGDSNADLAASNEQEAAAPPNSSSLDTTSAHPDSTPSTPSTPLPNSTQDLIARTESETHSHQHVSMDQDTGKAHD